MSGRSMQENWDLSRRKSMGVALLSLASAREEAEVYNLFLIQFFLFFCRMIPKMKLSLTKRKQMKLNQ